MRKVFSLCVFLFFPLVVDLNDNGMLGTENMEGSPPAPKRKGK